MTHLPCKKTELVFVRWVDAVNESVRLVDGEFPEQELAINTNIGWVVREQPDETSPVKRLMVLAHGDSTSGEKDTFKIPLDSILERIPVIGRKTKRKDVCQDDPPVSGSTVEGA